MLFPILVVLVVALTWARTFRPGLNRLEGATLLVARVPLLARIRMHATATVVSVGLAVIIALAGMDTWWLAAVVILSALLLIVVPVNYTITDVGIRLGMSGFRRWTEFAAVRRASGGARVIGVPKSRGMHIWLSGSRGDDEFLQFLRQTLKGAYKGTSAATASRSQHVMPDIDGDGASEQFSIAPLRQ